MDDLKHTRTDSNLSMSLFNGATRENNYLDLINTFKQNCELSFDTFNYIKLVYPKQILPTLGVKL